uniref:C3H1-type domain-containing protein n=1 Tax=Alexandrium monilatum TaxID=311494 RepID=A0A7S4SUD8_9DINO
MPARRPAPLSEDLFKPVASAAASNAVVVNADAATLLGATNNGVPLPVKNTFIDVPSGLTPSNMKVASTLKSQPVMTAPADLCKSTGFLQRAVVASMAQVVAGPVIQGSGSPTGSSNGNLMLHGGHTPLATPSPTHAATTFRQWRADAGAGMVVSAAAGSRAAAPVLTAPRSAVPASTLEEVADVAEEDENDDEDSDDGAPVPHHLRNPADAPKPPPGALHPSLGSEAHAEANCKRCCFFPRGRCTNGYSCEFCHYEHEKRKRKSKKKKKKDAAASAEATSAASETSPVATVTSPVATVASPGASAVVIPATTVTSPTTTVTSPTTTVTSPVTTFIAVASPLAAVTGPADARMVAVPMPAGVAGAPVHAPPLPPGAAPPMAFAAGPTPLPPAPPAGAVVGPGLPPAAAAPPAGVAVGVPPGPPAAMLVGAPVLAAATTVLQPALAHVIYGPTQQYAPPPQLPPRLQQVVELTPPPPMQSPKMRQGDMGIVQGGAPISSR